MLIKVAVGGKEGTPRAPARAYLSLLPSGPGEVRRVSAARGVSGKVYVSAPLSSSAEDSPSGLWRSLGKRVGSNPSGVQIPYPPPCRESRHTSLLSRDMWPVAFLFQVPGDGERAGVEPVFWSAVTDSWPDRT